MIKPLSQVKKNTNYKISSITGDVYLKRRVLELGILPNEKIKILSISPLKNSYLVAVKNYSLALRKNILDNILVEEIWKN